jgi:hypothetical protein
VLGEEGEQILRPHLQQLGRVRDAVAAVGLRDPAQGVRLGGEEGDLLRLGLHSAGVVEQEAAQGVGVGKDRQGIIDGGAVLGDPLTLNKVEPSLLTLGVALDMASSFALSRVRWYSLVGRP